MPAPDWLEGLGGAFGGVTQGLTAGAAPFAAWDRVVSSGLANDRSAIALRDFERLQQAREAQPDFYGNVIGSQDTTNRLTTSKGNRDIFGIDQSLAASRYMADPNDAFQQTVQALGLKPDDPEYRRLAAEAQSYYDPLGAIAGVDKMNIPGIESRNLNEQAVTAMLTAYAQRADKGAQVVRVPDGTYVIIGSDGQTHSLDADQAYKAAAAIAAKTPMDAYEQGLKMQVLVNDSNARLQKVMDDRNITPAVRGKMLTDQRVLFSGLYNDAARQIQALQKDPNFGMLTKEEKAAQLQPHIENAQAARAQLMKIAQLEQVAYGGGRFPATGGGGALPPVTPMGTPQVTAPKVSVAEQVARAIGGGEGAMGPWGMSAQGPAYPARSVSSQDTGVQPITSPYTGAPAAFDQFRGSPANFNLDEYVQSLLQQAQAE